MSDELKPCPFCGGEDIKKMKHKSEPKSYTGGLILCMDCGCEYNAFGGQDAITAWNTRANDTNVVTAPPVSESEALKPDEYQNEIINILQKYGVKDIYNAETEIVSLSERYHSQALQRESVDLESLKKEERIYDSRLGVSKGLGSGMTGGCGYTIDKYNQGYNQCLKDLKKHKEKVIS